MPRSHIQIIITHHDYVDELCKEHSCLPTWLASDTQPTFDSFPIPFNLLMRQLQWQSWWPWPDLQHHNSLWGEEFHSAKQRSQLKHQQQYYGGARYLLKAQSGKNNNNNYYQLWRDQLWKQTVKFNHFAFSPNLHNFFISNVTSWEHKANSYSYKCDPTFSGCCWVALQTK